MEYRVNVLVPYGVLAEAENQVNIELVIQQCVVCEVRDEAELMISGDITWSNHMKTIQQRR